MGCDLCIRWLSISACAQVAHCSLAVPGSTGTGHDGKSGSNAGRILPCGDEAETSDGVPVSRAEARAGRL